MSILSKLFGGSSEKRDTTYRGPQRYANLAEAQGGRESLDELKRRLMGVGVGYGANYESAVANPIVQNMRAGYNQNVKPELLSELSATGRRRGSAGFQQLSQSLSNQNLEEGDVYARLYAENEAQKRNEINSALTDIQGFAKSDVGVQGAYVGDQQADHEAQLAREDTRRKAKGEENLRAVQAVTDLADNYMTGGMYGMAKGPITSASYSGSPQYNPDPRANLPYGSGNSLNQRLALRKALSGGFRK